MRHFRSEAPRDFLRYSLRATVEVFYRNRFKVNVFEAPDIDRRHWFALWIDGLGIRMNAACLAEMVLDNVLVERVRADTLSRRA
jgi:hypothetical protein